MVETETWTTLAVHRFHTCIVICQGFQETRVVFLLLHHLKLEYYLPSRHVLNCAKTEVCQFNDHVQGR